MSHRCLVKRSTGVRRSLGLLFLVVALLAGFLTPQAPRAEAAYYTVLYHTTNGFDTCAAKTQTMLSDWWNGTPWWDIGVYLGGSVGHSVGCDDGAAAVDRALNTGYGVVLYWYGPQLGPPCNVTTYSNYISLNTTTAYNQGVSEANSASSAASAAHLPYASIIFYDMEGYYANSGCRAASKAFINGWDHQLFYNTAWNDGAYGSSCSSYVSDWASIANVPTSISPSDANPPPGLDNASVDGYPCLSNSLWSQHQRVGQNSNAGFHKYNNYGIYVDENCTDTYYLPSPLSGGVSAGCSDVL
jgi:hypothetical protein